MTAVAHVRVLEVRGLCKSFGGKVVLDGIDLDVTGYLAARARYNRNPVR